ncbi:hypothetical protein [uncultured Mameliella sp.]|uniref:hypothetical protein n=1 Tax=uncultured Mameliella sp. TaxID=1447087 RepID=UPI002631CE9B|nr:hypothetical protein [uncultured Mameliella sp.]
MSYTLLYWPIPFRGHVPRFILSQAGAEWDEPGFDAVLAAKTAPPEEQPTPFIGPPVLIDHDTGRALSQMPAICMYLGRKHGLSHDPDMDLRLLCDASDILLEITCHHGATMWTRDSWTSFRDDRLPRWMRGHERLVTETGVSGSGGYMSGAETPGLSDLALAALWHTMVDRLPPLRPLLHDTAPVLAALVNRVAGLPALLRLRDDWADCADVYCAGQIEASLLEMLNEDMRA